VPHPSPPSPPNPQLVFSQYTSTLEWLQQRLPQEGLSYRTITGSMGMKQRAKAIEVGGLGMGGVSFRRGTCVLMTAACESLRQPTPSTHQPTDQQPTPTNRHHPAPQAFQQDPPTTVFLLSVRSGAVGINLTAANYVFLLEPCINPALEEQAIGRAWRMGQQRPVTVKKFFVKGGWMAGWGMG
jgi:hypothetical protein